MTGLKNLRSWLIHDQISLPLWASCHSALRVGECEQVIGECEQVIVNMEG